MSVPTDPAARAARMRARAKDWAAGAREGKALDRKLAAAMTPGERLAEGVAMARIAEQLQASMRRRSRAA